MITLTAQFTMRPGKVRQARALVAAVKRQSQKHQPGTLVYLVHRVRAKSGAPGRTLLFYEQYRNQKALNAHLQSSAWQAIEKNWKKYFEGGSAKSIHASMLKRIAAFERPGAIPAAR